MTTVSLVHLSTFTFAMFYRSSHNDICSFIAMTVALTVSFCDVSNSRVGINDQLCDWFEVCSGVWLGCLLSPPIYNLYV